MVYNAKTNEKAAVLMNKNETNVKGIYGSVVHTTQRREWFGWFGSMSWLFFMM
jgi:hypothetical protein